MRIKSNVNGIVEYDNGQIGTRDLPMMLKHLSGLIKPLSHNERFMLDNIPPCSRDNRLSFRQQLAGIRHRVRVA